MAFTTIPGAEYGADTAFIGTESVDTIAIVGLEGSAYLVGEADDDIITFQNFTGIVTDYTLKGGQGNDSISDLTTSMTSSFIAGNLGNDTIGTFNVTSSTLQGGQGNDSITTRDLTATLVAGNLGNDTLDVDAVQGASVWGGQGNDLISVSGIVVGSTIEGNLANDRINITTSTFISSTVSGGLGNDTVNGTTSSAGLLIEGNEGNDVLSGGTGDDTINGGDDNDQLLGGAGTDTLSGGTGNDTLTGGAAADTLIGGEGSNRFTGIAGDSFSGSFTTTTVGTVVSTGVTALDTITDWTPGTAAAVIDTINYTAADLTLTKGVRYDTLADAIKALSAGGADQMTTGYEIVAIGAAGGTSFTAVLFIDSVAGSGADGAVQLGGTGIYGDSTTAINTSIFSGNITA